jgi:hypothetical protein
MKLFEASSASSLLRRTLLVRGGAFHARYECLDEGAKERFFVVANINPANDDRIILFTATTKIAKRRAHHGQRADRVLVQLDPNEYDGVTEACVLDCESPVKRARGAFLRDVDERKYEPAATVPGSIMNRIAAAVRASRTLSAAEKRLIIGDLEPGTPERSEARRKPEGSP